MPKVKICGLTNLDDARCAVEAGADFLGFVFYPPSPRYIPPETARTIIEQLHQDQAKSASSSEQTFQTLGIFVNHSLEEVRQTLDTCALDFAQLHGDEDADFLAQLEGRAFKATNPQSLREAQQLAQQFTSLNNPFFLLDAYDPKLRGGTGHIADWAMAAQVAQTHQVILAGGLKPDNVADAVAQVRPWGVDVSSGVEARKGVKDPEKVRQFVWAAKKLS